MSEKYYTTVLENFKRWAPIYDAFSLPFKSARKAVTAKVNLQEEKKVLDVCTGTGAIAIELARAGASVTGIDLSEDMLRQARRKRGADALRFLRMDATDMMFGANEFDAATISWGLHEMPLEIIRRVLREIHRVTKRQLVVFDYRQPESKMLASIYRSIMGLYEGPYCIEFLNLDLSELTRAEGFELDMRKSILLGTCTLLNFRIVK